MEHTRRILEKDEIRVLAYDSELTRNSGVLACRTKILQLSDVDPNGTLSYAAISYVWGDPGITSPLICDGATVSVTSNLLEALSTIWKGYPWRQLWADAISITQDNLAERNHQVSLMGDIFRSADNVFVSLGPALRGGNLYWNLLKSFMTRGRFDGEEFEEQLDEFMEGADNELAMGFDDLIHRPWFRRAWTYQEIRLARTAIVFCGDSSMSWNEFVESLHAFNKTGAFLNRFSTLRTFLKQQAFRFTVSDTLEAEMLKLTSKINPLPLVSKKPLLDLLVDGWPRDATDARDKIYAFTSSHLSSTSYAELKPDYSLNIRSTFIRLIRIYINNENNLNFLEFALGIDEPVHLPDTGIRDEGYWVSLPNLDRIEKSTPTKTPDNLEDPIKFSQTEGLPSWICDWQKQSLRPKVDVPPFLANENYFDMRKNILPLRQSVHDFGNRLAFKGCALARVGHPQSELLPTSKNMLGIFSRLPKCALQKALGQDSETMSIPRQRQLFDHDIINGEKNPPISNIVLLLLQTLLHDQIDCDCEENQDLDLVKAHCSYGMYPRSYACNGDWLFVLDGLAEPAILRPHIIPGAVGTSRSEIGFDFVSVCPLIVRNEREKWSETHFAYGQAVLY